MEDLILIVDDARFARRIETKALQDAGFEHIVEAKTAKEALQIFEEHTMELPERTAAAVLYWLQGTR